MQELLGITQENIIAIFFIAVTILFMLLFFIIFGIKAFSFGGTFGAVINSLLPVGNFIPILFLSDRF